MKCEKGHFILFVSKIHDVIWEQKSERNLRVLTNCAFCVGKYTTTLMHVKTDNINQMSTHQIINSKVHPEVP